MSRDPKVPIFSVRNDWPNVQQRWCAFWDRQNSDRPCISITCLRQTDMPIPVVPESIEMRYMNPEYLSSQIEYYFASTSFYGEAPPAAPHQMAGTVLGCISNIDFSEGAIEIKPVIKSINEKIPWYPGPDDLWRPKVEKIVNKILDMALGTFMVDQMSQYPLNDLIPLLRGSTEFMMDLVDDPDLCVQKLRELFPLWLENSQYFRSLLDSRQGECGTVLWNGTWSPDRVRDVQSDMSVMISKEMFERFVLPELDMVSDYYDYLWYHVCGCKRHLGSLLTRSYIRAFQYAPNPHEPPNGSAHIDFYREIQAAGRCLDISVENNEDMEYVIRHLRPEGLSIHTHVQKKEDAELLIANAFKWCGTHCHSHTL